MKKIMSLMLSALFAITLSMPAEAQELFVEEKTSKMDPDLYASEIIHAYIDMNIKDVSKEDVFFLTQGFSVEGNTEPRNRTYFLFENEDCIGKLVVSFVNGEYISNFVLSDIPILSEAYKNNKGIILISDTESAYVATNSQIFCLYGVLAGEYIDETCMNYTAKNNSFSLINLNNIEYKISDTGMRAGNGRRLDIEFVDNDSLPEAPNGICWIAVVSSIANYRTNSSYLYSAENLYYAIYNTYHPLVGGEFPHGNETWIKYAYMYLGVTVQDYDDGMRYSAVKAKIDAGIPIHADITTATGSPSHSVAICGYQSASGAGYFYILMDPNEDNYVTISLPSSGSTTFTYNPGNSNNNPIYTNWFRSFY